MAQSYTVRVTVVGQDEEGNEHTGTVVINVNGVCDSDRIREAAMNFVDMGGFFTKSHGVYNVTADLSQIASAEWGLHPRPSVTLNC